MIDTIRLVYERLSPKEQEKIVIHKNSTKGAIEFYEHKGKIGEKKIKHVVKCNLASSSYEINYRYDARRNEVIMEFSIPKYIYGTNVYMFPLDTVSIKYELEVFLKEFWNDNFGLELDSKRLSINRIDFCYNYKFANEIKMKAFKKSIFENMRNIYPKSKVRNYGTETVMYVTQNYSFKVYDKAVEFEKHDYNDLLKSKSNLSPEEVAKMLEDSRRILRFEITFRKKKLVEVLIRNFKELVNPEIHVIRELKQTIFNYNTLYSLVSCIERNINKYIKIGNDKYMIKIQKKMEDPIYEVFNRYSSPSKEIWDRYIEKGIKVSQEMILDSLPRIFRRWISDYNRLYSSKRIFLSISEIERMYNKTSMGFGYPLTELYAKKLLDIFKDNIAQATKGLAIHKAALIEHINANKEDIYQKLKIRPAALINFIENPNIQVSNRTKKCYMEKIEIIKSEYGWDTEYDFNQF